MNILFCAHPLDLRKVDESYEVEYQVAKQQYPCAWFSYEALMLGKLALYGEPISGETVYRGWMMSPEQYRTLYLLLERQGIRMVNTPEDYNHYHLLPRWYEEFSAETAYSIWNKSDSLDDALDLTQGLEGPYIVKDYVKSRKHEWLDACYIADIRDRNEAARVIGNFLKRQGSTLVGGVVLRQFMSLKAIGYHAQSDMPISKEYRVFIYQRRILAMDDYWESYERGTLSLEERAWIETMAQRVQSPLVTMDLARREDGTLIIMELGDGQVSGLQQIPPMVFYEALSSSCM